MSVTFSTSKTSESTLVGSGGIESLSTSKVGSGGVATASKDPISLTSESEHTHAFAKKAFMTDHHVLASQTSHDTCGVYPQGRNERVVIFNPKGTFDRQLSVLSLSDPSDYESAPTGMRIAPWQLLMAGKDQILRNDSKMTCGDPRLVMMARTGTCSSRKPKSWAGAQLQFSEPYPWPPGPPHFIDTGSLALPKVDRPVSYLAYDEMSQSVIIGTRNGALMVKKGDAKDATIVRQPRAHDYPVIFLSVLGTTLVVVDYMSVETWDLNTLLLQRRYQPPKERWGWDRDDIPHVVTGSDYWESHNACYVWGSIAIDYTTGTLFAKRYPQKAEAGQEKTHLLDIFEHVTTVLEPRQVSWGPAPYRVGTIAADSGVLFLQLLGAKGSLGTIIAAFHTANPPKVTTKGALTWPLIQKFTVNLFNQLCAGRNALVLAGGTGEIRLIPLNRQDEPVTPDPFADIVFKHEPGYDVYHQKDFIGEGVGYRTNHTLHRQSDKSTVALLPTSTSHQLEVFNLDQSENDLTNFGREKTVEYKYQMKGQVTFFGRTRFTILDDSKRATYEIEPDFDVTFLGVIPKRIIAEYMNDSLKVTFQKAESVPTKITHELYDESSDTHFMAEATGLIRVVVGPQSLKPVSRVLERAPHPVIFMGVYLKKLVIVGESSIEIWNIHTFTRVGNFGTVTKSVGSGGAASAAALPSKAIYAAAALDPTTGQLFVKRASSTEKEHVMDVFENLDILRPRRFLNYYPYDLTSFDAESGTLFMYFVMQSKLQGPFSSASELRERYGIPGGTCSIVCPFHTASGTIMNAYTHEAMWSGFRGFRLSDDDILMGYEHSKVLAGKNSLLLTHRGGFTLFPLKYALNGDAALTKAKTEVAVVQPTPVKTAVTVLQPTPVKTAVTALQPTATAPAPANPFEIALGYPRPISAKTPKFVAEETATRDALSTLGKSMKEAVDNGDCFYHSCAMLLNHHKGLNLTISDIRKQVASAAQAAANAVGQKNWLLPYFNNDVLEFKRWVKNVSTTGSVPGTIVEWGNFERDTAILGRIYGVTFKLFMNGKFAETSFGMKASKTVLEVAQFSNHFAPIF